MVVLSIGEVYVTTLEFAHGTVSLGPRSPVVERAPDATAWNGFESDPAPKR